MIISTTTLKDSAETSLHCERGDMLTEYRLWGDDEDVQATIYGSDGCFIVRIANENERMETWGDFPTWERADLVVRLILTHQLDT